MIDRSVGGGGNGVAMRQGVGWASDGPELEPPSSPARLRVLGLASYPVEAAATRYRMSQYVEPLSIRGIDLRVDSFLDRSTFERLYEGRTSMCLATGLARALARRAVAVARAHRADAVLIQREAMLLGPPVLEWLIHRLGRPIILDLDDAVYVRYASPTHGSRFDWLKCFGKTDRLIDRAALVVCGNRHIADYVEARATRAEIIPTVVDTEVFRPRPREARPDAKPVIGWIGSHSTYAFVEGLLPVLAKLATYHDFRLRLVGAGRNELHVPGLDTENVPWDLATEVQEFQSLDIGLYPIDPARYGEAWAQGKSGFKAIQYLAVGVPYVVSPVGVCAEIGQPGLTHLEATSPEEWHHALGALLSNRTRRRAMGVAGRRHAIENYGLEAHADRFARAIASVAPQPRSVRAAGTRRR